MIDIEENVYNSVATALRTEFSNMFVANELTAIPSTFPAAMGEEMDNNFYTKTMDLAGEENHSNLMWQWESYSNLSIGKKAQCKAIMSVINAEMQRLGFIRISCSPMPNADSTKHRMVSRFRTVVSKSGVTQKLRY